MKNFEQNGNDKTNSSINMAELNPQRAAQILGISLNATEKEAKQSYRTLIRRWHPDNNPNNVAEATKMSQLVIIAYELVIKHIGQNKNYNPQQAEMKKQTADVKQNTGTTQNQKEQTNYSYDSEINKAWENLQEAFRNHERAKNNYKIAELNEKIAFERYKNASYNFGSVKYGSAEFNKRKQQLDELRQEYNRAQEYKSKCLSKYREEIQQAEKQILYYKNEYERMKYAGFGTKQQSR